MLSRARPMLRASAVSRPAIRNRAGCDRRLSRYFPLPLRAPRPRAPLRREGRGFSWKRHAAFPRRSPSAHRPAQDDLRAESAHLLGMAVAAGENVLNKHRRSCAPERRRHQQRRCVRRKTGIGPCDDRAGRGGRPWAVICMRSPCVLTAQPSREARQARGPICPGAAAVSSISPPAHAVQQRYVAAAIRSGGMRSPA